MQRDGHHFMLDIAAKFFNTLRISGWFHHAGETLAEVTLHTTHVLAVRAETGLPHQGVASLGPDKGFCLTVLRAVDDYDPNAELEFTTSSGWRTRVRLEDLVQERCETYATRFLMDRFRDAMHATPDARLLDVGGRARSGLERRKLFATKDYVVLDVIADPTVDVVGDAHRMADFFPENHFDGIISVSVFEHLMMPWVVATQMNRVLKRGGLALIFTHQTLGMHDAPWDFWRFSDTAWDSLFNPHTGFEILDRALDSTQFVVPFLITPNKEHAERAAGFEGSAVLVRKTGPCRMTWPLAAADVAGTMYPVD